MVEDKAASDHLDRDHLICAIAHEPGFESNHVFPQKSFSKPTVTVGDAAHQQALQSIAGSWEPTSIPSSSGISLKFLWNASTCHDAKLHDHTYWIHSQGQLRYIRESNGRRSLLFYASGMLFYISSHTCTWGR